MKKREIKNILIKDDFFNFLSKFKIIFFFFLRIFTFLTKRYYFGRVDGNKREEFGSQKFEY
jgi:hypothetical protein